VNRISEYRQRAGLELHDVAAAAGLDEIEVAMAERGIDLVHFDVVVALAEALDAHPGELFPGMAAHFDSIQESEAEGGLRDEMLAPEKSSAFLLAGIDPDIASWYVIVSLRSGNERRYRVSSLERENIRNELALGEGAEGFLTFISDCRSVAISKSAISELRITNSASYAPFSSHESAFRVVILSPRSPRPEIIAVEPDGGVDGAGPRPFADFVEAARNGKLPASFLLMEEDGDEVYIGIDRVEAIEIPLGVLMPDLYGSEYPSPPESRPATLEDMEAMGQA